ncbi:LysR family transcriptional regulator [Stappia sp. F7233]|uniref:LysR family transcriptional regulator n=1 Tax=Stappia albiluteola TaxID=2758565 RepID=A0A839AAG2_9HYPH|nr:LysR family transcriptional regulator [Stappia albiluteola]MBA5776176.1 LysR family transcriptional regulator [Stappia albiluteola]
MLVHANRLQLKDFRLILAIRDTGQLALAAAQLAMTQPAASRMLAGIEQAIGAPVFHRHPKGMTPTPIGEIIARNAVGLLNNLDRTLGEVHAVGLGRAGSARVGAVTGSAVAFVVPAIQQLKKTAAKADIHVDVAPSDALIAGLLKGEYDFVLSRIPAGTDARQFNIRRGRVEVVRFLVRESHPLAGQKLSSLGDLAGFEWVIQAPHTPMRQAVEEAFVTRAIPLPDEIVNTTSLLVMIAYLSSSDAIGPISREVGELLGPKGIESGLVALELDEPIIVNPYHLISRKNHVMSPLAQHLRELVVATMAGEGGE